MTRPKASQLWLLSLFNLGKHHIHHTSLSMRWVERNVTFDKILYLESSQNQYPHPQRYIFWQHRHNNKYVQANMKRKTRIFLPIFRQFSDSLPSFSPFPYLLSRKFIFSSSVGNCYHTMRRIQNHCPRKNGRMILTLIPFLILGSFLCSTISLQRI